VIPFIINNSILYLFQDSESSKFIHTEDNLDFNDLLSDLINFDTTSKLEIGKLNMEVSYFEFFNYLYY